MASEKKKVSASQVMKEKSHQERDKLYNKYVNQMTPKHNRLVTCLRAFISGGIICTLGQALVNY